MLQPTSPRSLLRALAGHATPRTRHPRTSRHHPSRRPPTSPRLPARPVPRTTLAGPRFPQQVHLDLRILTAPDTRIHDDPLRRARDLATHLGAITLKTYPAHTVYADPAGHPFCV
ncbi:VOC family protein [Kribbella sp. NBC_00359]|uniref:VOC family protein n=1 Tax=Kribbella sp. NBC_00359 TaxID=2975966 RepID=UPI003FA57BFD